MDPSPELLSLSSLLTVVIVTSPSPTNPGTVLVSSVVASVRQHMPAVSAACRVLIVADGCVVGASSALKKGKVTAAQEASYIEYKRNLRALCAEAEEGAEPSRLELLELPEHAGFACAVKLALERCNTPFAFVCQHDRVFQAPLERDTLDLVLRTMADDESIRYVGLTTINNSQHDQFLTTCGLGFVIKALSKPLHSTDQGSTSLLPLLSFYDSNHLCHVARYLQLYRPFMHVPPELRARLGDRMLIEMVLRRGDFTEDRFGQQQRKSVLQLKENTATPRDVVLEAMRWFGTYLLWVPPTAGAAKQRARVFVGHLRGRQRQEEDVVRLFSALCRRQQQEQEEQQREHKQQQRQEEKEPDEKT